MTITRDEVVSMARKATRHFTGEESIGGPQFYIEIVELLMQQAYAKGVAAASGVHLEKIALLEAEICDLSNANLDLCDRIRDQS